MAMIGLIVAMVAIGLLAGIALGCFMAFMVAVRVIETTYDNNEKNNDTGN